ncbi:MAG: TolC family protein [Eubacteriales bacterium]|nr:TolC family protein [Eubacteriales bacterium]
MGIIKNKLIILFIIIFSTISFANDSSFIHPYRTTEEWEKLNDDYIEFNEIEDLVHEYNPIVKNNWNKYEYGKTNDDISQNYYDSADSLFSMAQSLIQNDTTKAQGTMMEAQAYGMQMSAENNLNDSEINRYTYEKAEKEKVLFVKQTYVNYLYQYLDYEIAKEKTKDGKNSLESANRSFNFGALTKVELLSKEKELLLLESAELSAKNNYENTRKTLLIELGKDPSKDIQFEPLKFIEDIDILTINLENDILLATNNNFQLKIYYKKKINATTTELVKEQENNYNASLQYIYNDIISKYNTIINQQKIINAKFSEYNSLLLSFQKEQKEYYDGRLSLRNLEKSLSNLNISLFEYMKSKYTLIDNYLSYQAAIQGIAATV